MPEPLAPVPNPNQQPKTSDEMAREGEREGDVLVERDHSQGAPEGDGSPARAAVPAVPNGD